MDVCVLLYKKHSGRSRQSSRNPAHNPSSTTFPSNPPASGYNPHSRQYSRACGSNNVRANPFP